MTGWVVTLVAGFRPYGGHCAITDETGHSANGTRQVGGAAGGLPAVEQDVLVLLIVPLVGLYDIDAAG